MKVIAIIFLAFSYADLIGANRLLNNILHKQNEDQKGNFDTEKIVNMQIFKFMVNQPSGKFIKKYIKKRVESCLKRSKTSCPGLLYL